MIGAKAIGIGAALEDATGYPDCRPVFHEAFNRVIETGTKPGSGIRIGTPIIHMRKSEIVRKGVELGAPLHLTSRSAIRARIWPAAGATVAASACADSADRA
ncbi:MAG: 7-cyano-7-deazaguanine synthase [Kiritimatiellia bacterium]